MSAGELAQSDDDSPDAAPPERDVSSSEPLVAAPIESGAPTAPANAADAELEALLEDWSFDDLAPIPPRFHVVATFSSRWKLDDGAGRLPRDEDGLPYLPLEAWLPALHDASLLAAEALDANRPDGPRWRAWHDYLFGGAGASGALAAGRLRIPARLRERLRVKPGQSDEHAMPRLRTQLTSVASTPRGASEAGVAGTILTAEAQWTPPADRLRALACTSLLAVAMQLVEQLGEDARLGFGRVALSISGFKNTHLALRWLDSHRAPPARNGHDAPTIAGPASGSVETPTSDSPEGIAGDDEHAESDVAGSDATTAPTDDAAEPFGGDASPDAAARPAPEHRRRSRADHGRDRIHHEEDAFPLASFLERELWRQELRHAARLWVADPTRTAAFWGSAFPGAADSRNGFAKRTPPASHWAHIDELGRRIHSEADAKTGSSWADRAKNSPRWRRVWPAEAFDRLAKVFSDPKQVWELLFDAAGRRGGWPTLTTGADKRLAHDLWAEAVQAFLGANAEAARRALGEPTQTIAEAVR